MAVSLKRRILLTYLAVSVLTCVATGLIVNSVISNRIIEEIQERVKEALNTAKWVYVTRVHDLDRVIRLTALRHVVRNAAIERNPAPIKDEMLNLMAEEKLDFLTLLDRSGKVIFRFHNPATSGDDISYDPFVREALGRKGVSGTQILPREVLLKDGEVLAQKAVFQVVPTPREKPTEKLEETSGMVLKSAQPVVDGGGRILGVLMGGMLLNRNFEIVDRIKSIVFKDARYRGKEIGTATIFLNDLRISTNVLDKEGNRAVGTRIMKEVHEEVLQKGLAWVQRAYVVDDWYITAYEPIRDFQDNIVGVLYVGILESKYIVLRDRLFLLFMLGMLFPLICFCWLSFRVCREQRPDQP
jgi:two-component system, NtrC family, sensor kinase